METTITLPVQINGRKRAEQALLDREQRLNQLISLMPAGTYACDAAGRITFFNRRAAELKLMIAGGTEAV